MDDFSSRSQGQNPYDAPRQAGPVPSGPVGRRPTSAVVFGVLNLVFGFLGLCGSGFAAFALVAPVEAAGPNPALDVMKDNPAFYTYTMASLAVGLVATVALIAAGIGLLAYKSWGRTLSIWYGVYGVISVVVGTVVTYYFMVVPLMQQAQNVPNGPERAGMIGGAIGGVAGGCIGLIYPVALLIFMLRPSFAEALRKE